MPRTTRDPLARDRIVEAAARAVATHGVRGASMRVIATEAGVTTGFITYYFADKHEVMEEVLDTVNRQAARRVRAAISTDAAPLEKLRAAVETMLPVDPKRRQEWQIWVAVWGEASKGDSLSTGYKRGWAGLRAMFAELLEEAQREEHLHADIDTEHRANRLVTLLAGIGLLAGVEKPARVRDMAVQMLGEELAWLGDPQPLA